MQSVVGERIIPLSGLNLADHSLSDPFKPIDRGPLDDVRYWMEILKLPGEAEIEREEARALEQNDESTATNPQE